MPSGVIVPYGGATAPTGWFLCDGTEVSKTDYATLYAVIGDSFGTASDSSHFVLPDLREATTKGVGLTGKSNNHYDSDGVALGEFVDDRILSHNHSQNAVLKVTYGYGASNKIPTTGSGDYSLPQTSGASGSAIYSNSVYNTGYATNEVKAVGVNYIIKA